MTTIWNETFDGTGYVETWSAGETVDANFTLDEDFAVGSVTGSDSNWIGNCLRVLRTAGGASSQEAKVEEVFSTAVTNLYFRFWFAWNVEQEANFSAQKILQVLDSGGSQVFAIVMQPTGTANAPRWRFDKPGGGNDFKSSMPQNTSIRVEAHIDTTAKTSEWFIDGTSQGSFTWTLTPDDMQTLRLGARGGAGDATALDYAIERFTISDSALLGDGDGAAGRIMGSLAGLGGLAGSGGIAGQGGGLAA